VHHGGHTNELNVGVAERAEETDGVVNIAADIGVEPYLHHGGLVRLAQFATFRAADIARGCAIG
jgi:hypothetical protein